MPTPIFAFKGNSGVRADNLARQFHGSQSLILLAYGAVSPFNLAVAVRVVAWLHNDAAGLSAFL